MKSFLDRLRFGSLAVLFGLSSLALSFSPLLSLQANAVSPQDNYYQRTTTPTIARDAIEEEVGETWGAIVADGMEYVRLNSTTVNVNIPPHERNYQLLSSLCGNTTFISDFDTAVTNGNYAVSQVDNYLGAGVDALAIYFTSASNQLQLNWGLSEYILPEGNPGGFQVIYLYIVGGTYYGNYGLVCETTNGGYPLSTSPDYTGPYPTKNYFVSDGVDLNLPPGYAGPLPPTTGGPQATFIPQVGYTLFDDNTINAVYIGEPSGCLPTVIQDGCIIPMYRYKILASDNSTVLDEKVLERYEIYRFTFPGYDTYYLEVSFVHPGPPYAPFSEDVVLATARFELIVNGIFVNGSTVLNDCTLVADVYQCGEADPLEDCSVYDTLVSILGSDPFPIPSAETIQCNLNNFGTWFRGLLTALFIPTYSFYTNFQTQLSEFLNSKLGFVATAFTFIIGVFGGIVTGAVTPTCTLAPPGSFFGASLVIDVCTFDEIYHAGFVVVQSLLIAITIIGLFFAGLRKYHEVVDQR